MHPEAREELSIRLKLTVLEYAKYFGATEACREFNVPRSSFYRWKQTCEHEGRAGLSRKKFRPVTGLRATALLRSNYLKAPGSPEAVFFLVNRADD